MKDLGIKLPPVSSPVANYVNAVRTGNLLYLSGKGPGAVSGKVGVDMTVQEAKWHARATGLNLISVMKAELGDLDRVSRVVKVLGMVNCDPEFTEQPKVINGCSDLFVEVFGDRGRHARSAVGMGSLPNGIPVEIEVIVEVAGAAPAATRAAPARKAAARKAPARKAPAAKKKVAKKAVKKAAKKKKR
ncbi:MAG: RidA family protein [Rhodospirillales bacterium]|nr:MAG: RidA family protein [Rhodospirillales bacterium]